MWKLSPRLKWSLFYGKVCPTYGFHVHMSFYVLNVFCFARWRTGARARPVRPYRMSRRPRFAQLAKQTEPKIERSRVASFYVS